MAIKFPWSKKVQPDNPGGHAPPSMSHGSPADPDPMATQPIPVGTGGGIASTDKPSDFKAMPYLSPKSKGLPSLGGGQTIGNNLTVVQATPVTVQGPTVVNPFSGSSSSSSQGAGSTGGINPTGGDPFGPPTKEPGLIPVDPPPVNGHPWHPGAGGIGDISSPETSDNPELLAKLPNIIHNGIVPPIYHPEPSEKLPAQPGYIVGINPPEGSYTSQPTTPLHHHGNDGGSEVGITMPGNGKGSDMFGHDGLSIDGLLPQNEAEPSKFKIKGGLGG